MSFWLEELVGITESKTILTVTITTLFARKGMSDLPVRTSEQLQGRKDKVLKMLCDGIVLGSGSDMIRVGMWM